MYIVKCEFDYRMDNPIVYHFGPSFPRAMNYFLSTISVIKFLYYFRQTLKSELIAELITRNMCPMSEVRWPQGQAADEQEHIGQIEFSPPPS